MAPATLRPVCVYPPPDASYISPPSRSSSWSSATVNVKLAGTDSTVVVNDALPSAPSAVGAPATAASPIMTLIAQPPSASPPP